MQTVVTITGIRPDFIRMSFVFKELDKVFNHILIHTGQHFDFNMSDIFSFIILFNNSCDFKE